MAQDRIPTDRKLDVVLAALRGAGLDPLEIVLTTAQRNLISPVALAIANIGDGVSLYRGIPLRTGDRSYVLVALPGSGVHEAPIGPRQFVRWFPLLPDPPGPKVGAQRRVA